MATRTTSLRGCDGFKVETADGLIGWVEEPCLEPDGLALRLADGRRGFVRAEDVRLVDPDSEEVVLAAGVPIQEPAPVAAAAPGSVPLRTIVLVIAALALLVAVEITLAFSVAKAVTGHAY